MMEIGKGNKVTWMFIFNNFKTSDRIFQLAIFLGIVCTGTSILFSDNIPMDVSNYYGPLVYEFSQGNFERAFFHSIPPLVPTLAGLISWLVGDPFMSLQLVSAIFFLLGLWPLRLLLHRLLPQDLIPWGYLLYITCPRLLRYVTMGILEGPKTFFILFMVERTVCYMEKRNLKYLFHMTLGMAGLCLTRGEGVGYFPLFCLFIFVAHLAPLKKLRNVSQEVFHKLFLATIRVFLFVFATLAICSPWIYYEYQVTGFPCFDSRQAQYGVILAQKLGWSKLGYHSANEYPEGTAILSSEHNIRDLKRYVSKTIDGFFLPFLLVIPFGIRKRWKSKKWNWIDNLLLLVIFYNYFLFLEVAHIKKRYIAPTIPFSLHWTLLGAQIFLAKLDKLTFFLREKWSHKLWSFSRVFIVIFITICVWDSMSQLRSYLLSDKIDKRVGTWIRGNEQHLNFNETIPLKPENRGSVYHNGRPLVLATTLSEFAYFARSDLVQINYSRLYPYEIFAKFCQKKNVDIVLVEKIFLTSCPDFFKKNKHFSLVPSTWDKENFSIYRFHPEGIKSIFILRENK